MRRPCSRRRFLGIASGAPLALSVGCGSDSSTNPSPAPLRLRLGDGRHHPRRAYGDVAAAAMREAFELLGGVASLVRNKTVA